MERAKAKLQEEETSLELANGEYGGMSRQVEAHKAETNRLAREAEVPRVEEVGFDMDVEGGTDTGEEVGVNFEAGKKRKVVRKARSSTGACTVSMTPEEVIRCIDRLSGPDKERCKNALLKEEGCSFKANDFLPKGLNVKRTKLDSMHERLQYLPRRTWLIRHVGRYKEAGRRTNVQNKFFKARGYRRIQKV